MTRGCTAFLHGHVVESVMFHPLAPFFVVGFTAFAVRAALELWKGRRLYVPGEEYWKRVDNPVLLGCLAFVVLFGGIRLALEVAGVIPPV